MAKIDSIAALEALYDGKLSAATTQKVTNHLTPAYRKWIMASRFCVLSTIGPGGTDGSPRGDDGPVVQELDARTLLMPDWRGNNRLDTLRNIVADGRISLMFMVPGNNNVMRINGTAELRTDADLIARFSDRGRQPRTVIVVHIAEVYSQCARAAMRAGLWKTDAFTPDLPTVGQMMSEITKGAFDGDTYDTEWPGRAEKSMW